MFKPHHLMIQVYRIFEFMVTGHHTYINITKKEKYIKSEWNSRMGKSIATKNRSVLSGAGIWIGWGWGENKCLWGFFGGENVLK